MPDQKIKDAVDVLKKQGVIVCPSESCYSLTCDARSKKAIEKIHTIKKEPKNKPLTLAVSNINQIKDFGKITKKIKKIAEQIFPAQLNLIIKENNPNKYPFLSKKGISFRVPKCDVLFALSEKLGAPIVTTSANIHGQPPIYNIKEIRELFEDKVDYILPQGNLNQDVPTSTIYDTRNNKIVRQGIINIKEIKKALNQNG
ncbi:threonylcarbamoyl-AMP synthase [Candidatus Pacearchaeota archaeon]|nr:threonylcarbamoyl-AMP synthase [Candidatus Pacearchaeota archaeon]